MYYTTTFDLSATCALRIVNICTNTTTGEIVRAEAWLNPNALRELITDSGYVFMDKELLRIDRAEDTYCIDRAIKSDDPVAVVGYNSIRYTGSVVSWINNIH